jgi:predicted nucleotidyltransferase
MGGNPMGVVERILGTFKALLAMRVPVRRVILFGSRARGDADPQSDLDVVVILEDSAGPEARAAVSECAWEAGFEHGIVVAPVVFTRKEWEEGPERESLLVKAVEAEGVVL